MNDSIYFVSLQVFFDFYVADFLEAKYNRYRSRLDNVDSVTNSAHGSFRRRFCAPVTFILAKQRAKQPCLHGYLAAAAGGRSPADCCAGIMMSCQLDAGDLTQDGSKQSEDGQTFIKNGISYGKI